MKPSSVLTSVALAAALGTSAAGATDPTAKPQATTAGESPRPALPSVRPREATTFALLSQEGLEYRIFVSAPAGPPPAGGYPVIYVLDANAWFGLAAEVTRLYELEGGPAIVVGVGYPVDSLYAPSRRGHDFTLGPPASGKLSVYEGTKFGGADAFLQFLRTGLRDAIGSKFKIDRSRQSLVGHSLGGYFVLHVLLTQPDSFSAYLAVSPAAWWDLARLKADEVTAQGRARPTTPPAVLIASGGAEQKLGAADENLFRKMYAASPAAFTGKTIDQVLKDTRDEVAKSGMVDNARDFAGRLSRLGIPAEFVEFADENHRSVVAPALGRGMPFLLRDR